MAKMDNKVVASAAKAQAAVKAGVWNQILGAPKGAKKKAAQSDLLGMDPKAAVDKVIAQARAGTGKALPTVDRVTRQEITTGKGLKAAQRATKAPGKLTVIEKGVLVKDSIEDVPAAARRSQFNGKRITVVDGDLYTGKRFRKGTLRAALLESIMAAKNVDDILGRMVKADNGKSRTVESIDIAFAVEVGCITLS
jgi:hypothetical protein